MHRAPLSARPHTTLERHAWPDPEKMGPSTPARREHARFSDGRRSELPLQQVLWYFLVQAKRPFEIPIPGAWAIRQERDGTSRIACNSFQKGSDSK